MNKSLFRYIWRHSKRDQLIIFAVVLASLPFYYMSLDLPRRIVNEAIQGRAFEQGRQTAKFLDASISLPSWLGGQRLDIFEGFDVGRLHLLFGLSSLFLVFVLINGAFKYWINVSKGALGERMMRRMRFELFSLALRFTPETLRTVKSSEAATIIKDEVEPIGGFIGDAFVQPVFLGTQAATALLFILMQSIWLGLTAAAVVGVQFLVIPRMRRELLRLGRMRQIASRRLAGRVSEVIDGMEAVHVHQTGRWERAEIGHRLYELFDIRFRIYKRKFIVKFLNNLLAQLTPFFFYAFGGYFALQGRLDIGQLVAVIAAYRELPPPLKELIDWDQQRLDVQVKYDQVVAYFAAEKLLPEHQEGEASEDVELTGPLEVKDLTIPDAHGSALVQGASLRLGLPARIAVTADIGSAASAFAKLLARRPLGFSGEVRIAGRDLTELPLSVVGRRIAYAGVEPILFPGSIRDNILYGLRREPVAQERDSELERRRRQEALRTGNPPDNPEAEWIDLSRSGATDLGELEDKIIELLGRLGLRDDLYRFGLGGTPNPERYPELAERLLEARERLHGRLKEEGLSDLIEFFDPARYNVQATVAENLLFGVPTSQSLVGRALAEDLLFREALDQAGLTQDLVNMGARIAETMVDIFRGLPLGHPLFDQFSFVHADELGEFEAILKRLGMSGRAGATREDHERLLALTLPYVEPRHRLGLLDEPMMDRLLAGRAQFREILDRNGREDVRFYDPDTLNPAATVRDNLLFGRVNEGVADARERVRLVGADIIGEMSLRGGIEHVGLDQQVGPAGRLLSSPQRAAVNLLRCTVKRPDILVVDGALAPFGEARATEAMDLLLQETEGRTLVAVLPNDRRMEDFDVLIRFAGGRAEVRELVAEESRRETAPAAAAAE
jgi:putative ABC transport system ATP-binding protein